MTDKRLDDLLRASMTAEEQPPELPAITPAKTKKRPVVAMLAACLCLCLCASAFLLMDFGDGAAPEAALDTSQSASAEDVETKYSVNESFKHSLTADSATGGSNAAAAAPAAPPITDPEATCSISSSANKWWQAMKQGVQPRFDLDDWETNYEVVGDSEQYHSIRVTKGDDFCYFTVDKTTCEMVKLEDVQEKMKTVMICGTALECRVERETMFYITNEQQLIVMQ